MLALWWNMLSQVALIAATRSGFPRRYSARSPMRSQFWSPAQPRSHLVTFSWVRAKGDFRSQRDWRVLRPGVPSVCSRPEKRPGCTCGKRALQRFQLMAAEDVVFTGCATAAAGASRLPAGALATAQRFSS